MEEGKSMEQQQQQQQQQQQLLIQQQLQQQRQQQMQMLMMQRQQQQQQAASISRFPAAARSSLNHPPQFQSPPQQQQQQIPNSPNPNHHQNLNPNSVAAASSNLKVNRSTPQAELQLAYQDLFKVCHPDHKRPFSSLEDACERLLPYHVVADYEAEEDDRILDSDTTGQMMSRSQQWDHNIAAKVAEFTATFEKQVHAFNIISRKRAHGEFRSEERLMIEQNLLQEQRRSLVELRAEWESRQKAGRDAHEASLRMAAMAAEQARAESQAHAEMMARGPIRQNALGSQGSNVQISNDVTEQEQEVNPEEMINGWGNNAQRDEKEPSEDFLNDDETDNGDAGTGEFDLNTR